MSRSKGYAVKKARDFAETIPNSIAADYIRKLCEQVRRLRHDNRVLRTELGILKGQLERERG